MVAMPERTYFTYIMASRSHTLYIGVTGDLRRRVFQHKMRKKAGFTARYNCDRLVWFQSFGEVSNAISREKELKGWLRAKKIALIEQTNPAWQDLARDWYGIDLNEYRRPLDESNTGKATTDPSLRSG
jgi:putative endonuclease